LLLTSYDTVFADLIGQAPAVELLTQAVKRDRVAPAYLFAGPDGVGRSLAATYFLQLLTNSTWGRNHPDVLWVEPTYLHQGKRLTTAEAIAAGTKRKTPPLIRLEQVREIAQFLGRAPMQAPRSVVIIEQAEAMQEASANALLKTLEEPGKATLILLAPSIDALLPTLVSRCQRIPFYRLNAAQMTQVLERCDQAEILNYPEILQLAQGSPGAAIAHWQQLQTIPPELLAALSDLPRSPRQALELGRQIDRALELESQLWLVHYLQTIYWQQALQQLDPSHRSRTFLDALEKAATSLRRNVQPRLVWEVTLLAIANN